MSLSNRLSDRQPSAAADTLARGLGWFSIALGLAELAAPRVLTRALGMQGSEALVQAYGAREIATGIGILASREPAPWLWCRVGGDVLDLGTLAAGLEADNPRRRNAGMAMAAVAGVTALDLVAASALMSAAPTAPVPTRNYHGRTGFRRPVSAMRGAARDFAVPRDFRIPGPLRPYGESRSMPAPP